MDKPCCSNPLCKGTQLKRTKPVVIFGQVPLMCLLCGHTFSMEAKLWREYYPQKQELR